MTEFRDQNGEQVDWSEIYAVIFDVDGTLYRQFPVRVHMGFRLASHFLLHPREIRDLIGIYQFRKLREEEMFQASSLEAQIHEAANRAGLPEKNRLHEVIQTWMFREPLSLIRRYANHKVLDLMDRLQDEGKQVVIWSDYAPEEKLAALDVKPYQIYYPGYNGISEMKPSEKSVRKILRDLGVDPKHTAFLGDRMEKDGKSALAAGIHFILI